MSEIEAPEERAATPEERIDLNAGWGPLNLPERRRQFERGRRGGWAEAVGSFLQGLSTLR